MAQDQKGLPTRLMLVAALVLVIGSVILASLLVIRSRMQSQVLDDFSADLTRSTITFREFQAQRLAALERENALLADLPSLKALMTTNDERTIVDAGAQFWKIGDNDLFALANSAGKVVAAYTRGSPADARLQGDLQDILLLQDRHFFFERQQAIRVLHPSLVLRQSIIRHLAWLRHQRVCRRLWLPSRGESSCVV